MLGKLLPLPFYAKLRRRVVGLTGGIASGKSTVSTLLSKNHHLPIIDADVLARVVVEPGTTGFSKIVAHFGPDRVLNDDGTLNRAALGEIVFKDPNERRWLNSVIHPAVRREMVKEVIKCWFRGEWCCVVDVPLLVEAGLWRWVGEVAVVFVNDRLQLTRLLARPSDPPLTEEQASARMASQMPLSDKTAYATYVLDNSGTPTDLSLQVDRVVGRWRKGQGGRSGWWWRVCLIPPVGLTAGLICLLANWWRSRNRGTRRRSRGEVDRRPGTRTEGESFEMQSRGGRRRGNSGIMDPDED